MDIVFSVAVALLLIAAAAWDTVSYRIPNLLCAAVAGLFLLHAGLSPDPFPTERLAVAAAVFAVGAAMFARNLMGGGDVKLLTAAVLWVPAPAAVSHIAAVALIGGLLGLVLLVLRRALKEGRWAERLPEVLRQQAPVPYGIAISLGTLAYLPFA